jgi:hypothetical protein
MVALLVGMVESNRFKSESRSIQICGAEIWKLETHRFYFLHELLSIHFPALGVVIITDL